MFQYLFRFIWAARGVKGNHGDNRDAKCLNCWTYFLQKIIYTCMDWIRKMFQQPELCSSYSGVVSKCNSCTSQQVCTATSLHTCQTFYALSSFGQGIYKILVCRTWQPRIWHNRITRHSKPGVATLYKWNIFIVSRFKVWPSIIGNLWVYWIGMQKILCAQVHGHTWMKLLKFVTLKYSLPPVVCFVQ